MTDKEMLLLTYGAMKAVCAKGSISNLQEVLTIVEEHLWPPKEEILHEVKFVNNSENELNQP